MLINFDLPPEYIKKLDDANEAVRIVPPLWPFKTAVIIEHELTADDRKKLREYRYATAVYEARKEASGGKPKRSRSVLLVAILDHVFKNDKLWHELTKLPDVEIMVPEVRLPKEEMKLAIESLAIKEEQRKEEE